MTYEEYWYGDVWMVEAFRKADKLSLERLNEKLWLQGMYFFDGLSRALNNIFSAKGTTPMKYPSEPYPLFEDEKMEEEKAKEEENERLKAMLYMSNMVRAGKDWAKQP